MALEAMSRAVLTRDLFDGLPRFYGLVFIRALRSCLAGDLSDRPDVCRIAKAIWRRVAVSRGPKLTHASAAHEYFLEAQSIFGTGAFTWSPYSEDFTDRLTQRRAKNSTIRTSTPCPRDDGCELNRAKTLGLNICVAMVCGAVFLDPRN
jgi:hypothetical protein